MLIDVRMPGMSGLQLQTQLAEEGITLPIIIITGHADVPMAVAAMRAGAVDFIEKPFNDDTIISSVQRALEIGIKLRDKGTLGGSVESAHCAAYRAGARRLSAGGCRKDPEF